MIGTWTMKVKPVSVPITGEKFYLSGGFVGGVQLNPQVSSLGTGLAQPVVISATLQDSQPITQATVTAKITTPNQLDVTLPMSQGSPATGIYTTSYIPALEGNYKVLITASGRNSNGTNFTRVSTTNFQASSAAQLTGAFNAMAYDTDGDGLYNNLTLTATVQVTQSGQYRLSGDLTMTDTSNTLVANSTAVYTLSTGVVSVTLPFDGSQIASALYDGAYQIGNLSLTKVLTDGELALSHTNVATTTQSYSRYTWQRPALLLVGTPVDYDEDTNHNGLYEYLDVSATVDIRDAGAYSVTAHLDSITGTITTAYTGTVGVVSGTNTLLLRFNGGDIAASGVDGPYAVTDLVLWRQGQYDSVPIRLLIRNLDYYSAEFEGGN